MASVQIAPSGTEAEGVCRNQKVLAVQEKIAQRASERGVLLVRVKDLPSSEGGTGMLTERQKQWLNTATYDDKTQNPVLHRRTVELSKPSKDAREKEEACLEVQSLTDKVTSAPSSGVAMRIQESRKTRHEQTIDDMKQELAAISSEIEPDIQKASKLVKTQLADNNEVIQSVFARTSNPELLQNLSLDHLHSLWSEISSQSVYRQQCIHTLDQTLCSVEEQRHQMVLEVLKSYAHQLEVIAYLLPPDVHRLIEEEAHTINMAIIANRRSYTQLCLHLMTADFAHMKEHRQKWESAVLEWKDLICKLTLNQFISFMESSEVVSPPDLERQKEFLAAEQATVNRRREELLQQMAGFRPPVTTKSAVYEWKESVEKLNHQLERIHGSYLLQFQSSQEAVVRHCEHRMEQCREYLVSSGAFDADSVYKVMTQHFLPLVEQLDQRMRAELQAVERSLDHLLSAQSAQFQSLYQYGQGAAHLWDTHMVTLEERERAFQEDLEKCRHQHDVENQNLEANLDVVLDRLRQSASQEVLGQFLEEALKMLETIKEGYVSFHTCLNSEAQKLPGIIQQELDSYDSSLCKYLGVDRSPPKGKRSRSQLTKAPSEVHILHLDAKISTPKKSLRRPSRAKTTVNLNPRVTVAPSHATPGKRDLSSIVGEVISTSHGTSFYIHTTSSNDGHQGPGAFLTQDEEIEGASLTFATENVTILEQAFINAKNGLRLGFLDHLEQWKLEMISKANETVTGKNEEASTELDLRLHLHEPRPSRIEQDLHHVRAAELDSHRDRVSRHSQGLMASVKEQKASIQQLTTQQEIETEKFATEVMMLESRLDSADKTNKLLKIQDQAKHLLEKHLQHVSSISGSHQSHCEQILEELDDSNQSYKASLKLFSEGGNYCPEEVEQFLKKLNKLSSKIASARTFIHNEVSALTISHSEAAWEVMKQFEALYLLHSADLSFLESVSQTLTSAQVGIKSEVARSNSQARDIFQNIDKISATIKKVQAKEAPCSTLLGELSEFFTALTKRTDYLFCHSVQMRGARVGSQPEVAPSPSVVKSSGVPISAVNVTRSILEQTSSKKKQSDSSSDRDSGKRQSRAVATPASHLQVQTGQDQKASVAGTPSGMLQPEAQRKSGRQSISSRRRTLAMERKHATFGIGGGEDGTDCFLPCIRAVLKTSHQALYSNAESYYKLKGTRPPTRPNEIQDNFEACIDSLITKCQQYRVQAEEYRNDCIEEFRHQLESAVDVLELVPGAVFDEVKEEYQTLLHKERTTRTEKYDLDMREQRSTKESHEKSLRPNLGHPSQREQLENLCSKEEDRHKAAIKIINEHALASKVSERQHTVKYILKLVETTKLLLTLFDSFTSSADIIPGSDRHKSKPPVEKLLRLHVNQQLGTSVDHEEDSIAELPSASFTPSKISGKTSGYVWSNLPESERKVIKDMLPPPTNISKKISTNNLGRSTTSRKKMSTSRMAERTTTTEPPTVNNGAGGRVGSGGGHRRASLKPAPPTEETILANMLVEKLLSNKWTSLHEVVIKTRDETIQEYMKSYRVCMNETKKQEESIVHIEEKWYSNWTSSVDKIKQLYS